MNSYLNSVKYRFLSVKIQMKFQTDSWIVTTHNKLDSKWQKDLLPAVMLSGEVLESLKRIKKSLSFWEQIQEMMTTCQ